MSIKSRLKQVEKAAGVVELCLWCKHQLVLYSDYIKRIKPDDMLIYPCRNCGFPFYVVLVGYSELERELIRELHLTERSERKSLEQRKRFYALQIYIYVLPRSREIREIGEKEEKRLRETAPATISARQQVKLLDEWKAVQAQIESVRRQKRTEEEDAERESRRAVSAPTMAVLHSVKAENLRDSELHYLKVMAGLEAIIFGDTLRERGIRLNHAKPRYVLKRRNERRKSASAKSAGNGRDRRGKSATVSRGRSLELNLVDPTIVGQAKGCSTMGWENRNGNLYYYRKERDGSRVRSVYIGSGETAHLISKLEAMRHEEIKMKLLHQRNLREMDEQVDNLIERHGKAADVLLTATLLAAGFHTHHRQWRRKRNG